MENKILMPLSIVLAGLFIAGAVYWNGQHPVAQGTTGSGNNGGAVAVNVKDVSTDGEPFIGSADAPVTLVEWSDYQCPFCQKWELETLPTLMQQYVNAGKVKIVFKDFQFLGPDSQADGEYARAIWHLYPSQFMAWRTALYANEPQENSMSASENLAFLEKTTKGIQSLDWAKVQADVSANQAAYDAAMSADKTEGGKFGISATPSFVLGTQMIAGAYPTATFTAALDRLLGK